MTTVEPVRYVLSMQEIARRQMAMAGGKGAQLGELLRVEGVSVPAGFCVTTDAFRRITALAPSFDDRLDRLSGLSTDDRESMLRISSEIRRTIEEVVVPDDLKRSITSAVAGLGQGVACAIRSSATAEDLPTASFAGQQDTYLNIVGSDAVLAQISRCWASLFTERAVTYRLRNGIDHRRVQMAVVVQHMVLPQSAGVLFTADPVTSNRRVAVVEAGFGLGEALVSGLVSPDTFKVRDGQVVAEEIGVKLRAVQASPAGGTQVVAVERDRQEQPALTREQVLRLVDLGRRIEAHFGCPQDIEWCLVDDDFELVQSRPITTLFPIPAVGDEEKHLYVSVGHQQMMTDPMRPLGFSVFQLTAARPMFEAGGRLFVDIARDLASPPMRARLTAVLGRSDPLIGDALQTILERGDFIESSTDEGPASPTDEGPGSASATGDARAPMATEPAMVVQLIARTQDSIAALKRDIRTVAGSQLFDFILADIQKLKGMLFDPENLQVIMAGMEAMWWLNDRMQEWLGETNAADALIQSVPNNVTSEMGLALLDVADAIRPHRDVVDFLRRVDDERFLDELKVLRGGSEATDAIESWLDKYGMRCVGEIDITRPRWSERPDTLLPAILANIRNFDPGESGRRFERGLHESHVRKQALLDRLRKLPDGARKADETKQMIDRARTFIGYREYPKYGIISRYFVYKQALLEEAERLVQAHVLGEKADVYYLTFQEFHEVVRTQRIDDQLLLERKSEFRSNQALTPPRVFTSEGEIVAGRYRRADLPTGALIGLGVSAGTVEGRARIVHDMAEADLEPGDILVTAHTDPSWTPLFVTVTGLVTEVGGSMTHGAVIAREYGLPAVVGVEDATQRIPEGQRIRVNGTHGYVELVDK